MKQKLNTILVGVDFSDSCGGALREAARLAKRDGAHLQIIHALTPEFVEHYRDSFGSQNVEILDKIRSQLARFASSNLPEGAEFKVDVFIGSAYEELIRAAEKFSADLVVLGSHGLTVRSDDVGNIASKCVRKAEVPVLLVRDSHQGAFERIVVGIDLSDASRTAVETGASMADRDGAELHILHVHSPPWAWASNSIYGLQAFPQKDFETEYRSTLDAQVDAFISPIRSQWPDLRITRSLVEHDSTIRALREYLTEIGADLVVTGSHGRGGLKVWMLGSTAERMISDSPCSVLTVRPPNS